MLILIQRVKFFVWLSIIYKNYIDQGLKSSKIKQIKIKIQKKIYKFLPLLVIYEAVVR